MERTDLYDENRVKTGEIINKGEPVPSGRYYITVIVWMQNSKGEFLIQKRVKSKNGKWASTGGHVISGETSEEGILREIKEELGIMVKKEELTLFKTIKTEDDFVDLYYVKSEYREEDITIQIEEVEKAKWCTADEIEKLIEEGKFSSSHAAFFEDCLKYLKNIE